MADLRARLVDALMAYTSDMPPSIQDWFNPEEMADVVLSLPGVAIVELPEPHSSRRPGWDGRDDDRWSTPLGPVTRWGGLIQSPLPIARPAEARQFAVALLSAANTAEEGSK